MAQVTLTIGGISHDVACRAGGEERLREAAALIDQRWDVARQASGGSPSRAMLLAALMLADSLIELRDAPPPESPEAQALAALAERLEALAESLEGPLEPTGTNA